MFTQQDLEQLKQKGISEATAQEQLDRFKTGFPFLELKGAATPKNGILQLDENEVKSYLSKWDKWLESGKKVTKFVPASGAASRMFKDLFAFLDQDDNAPVPAFVEKFIANLSNAAFYDVLDSTCKKLYGKDIKVLLSEKSYKSIVGALLSKEGMNYGNLPKGLLLFHRAKNGVRTPVEEHLVEGALYACGKDKKVNIHFTVSSEHKEFFKELVSKKIAEYEKEFGANFDVSYSEQKPSTDTIAADESNAPFRDNGKILFRPGGHGALIENLNDLNSDVVFIKNIDNVVPDKLKNDTVTYKKVLAGVLVSLQEKIDNYLKMLDSNSLEKEDLTEMLNFLSNELFCKNDNAKNFNESELVDYLKKKFNRPLRVCGMVKNTGEPGGGPFLAMNADGSYSLQVLESSQIDPSNAEAMAMMKNSTHFNPVDLVCSLKNYKGEKFNLPSHVDKQCGFISNKSKSGRALKALELPGLWNGAMSDWNTIFVEVPIITFNPVKTVNDLFRAEHQG
ncbi:MAG TPA: DUF4301 domain-containing protein [Porphyromonadaceae bacterium]|nr:DUF4301 domain-containing protein [Porphyromonadaceae bacterium]